MWSAIEHYTRKVCSCHKQRKPNTISTAPLVPIDTTQPFELVSVDFLHLERSAGGFEYILVIMNHFTRYAQAYATKNKEANTAADKLYNDFILWYGYPMRILHHQCPEFDNKLPNSLEDYVEYSILAPTPHTTPNAMDRLRGLTRLCFRCCAHCQKSRTYAGKTP